MRSGLDTPGRWVSPRPEATARVGSARAVMAFLPLYPRGTCQPHVQCAPIKPEVCAPAYLPELASSNASERAHGTGQFHVPRTVNKATRGATSGGGRAVPEPRYRSEIGVGCVVCRSIGTFSPLPPSGSGQS